MKRNWHKAAIFKAKVLPRIFGVQIVGLAMVLSLIPYPTHAFDYNSTTSPTPTEQVVVVTEPRYQFPLETMIGVSQGYHLFHPGVDYRAPRGTAVRAIESGVVIEVKQMLVGYGHFVRVAHNGTMSSLYAHLGEVVVVAGQKETKGETMGVVGM